MIKNVKNCDNLSLQIKVLPIFRLYKKNTPVICLILPQFNLYVLLICGKKLVTIAIFLSSHSKGGGGGGTQPDFG